MGTIIVGNEEGSLHFRSLVCWNIYFVLHYAELENIQDCLSFYISCVTSSLMTANYVFNVSQVANF